MGDVACGYLKYERPIKLRAKRLEEIRGALLLYSDDERMSDRLGRIGLLQWLSLSDSKELQAWCSQQSDRPGGVRQRTAGVTKPRSSSTCAASCDCSEAKAKLYWCRHNSTSCPKSRSKQMRKSSARMRMPSVLFRCCQKS